MPSPDPKPERDLHVLLCATGFPRSAEDHHKPFLLDHARALAGAGAKVTVVCPGAAGLAGHQVIEGIDVVRFRYGPRSLETLAYDGAMYRRVKGIHALLVPFFILSFLATAALTARRRGVDIVHGHWWAPSGLVVLAVARLVGARSVVHLHGSDVTMAKGPVRHLARWVLARVDLVMAVSGDLADWARELLDHEPRSQRRQPAGNGGSAAPEGPNRPGQSDRGHTTVVVAPMPLPRWCDDAVTPPPTFGPLLGVGRLLPEKGFDLLVRAAAVTDQAAVIVGDGPERQSLEELAESLGADVTFAGEVAPDELAEYYRRARMVVVPSRREGFGMVAAEAAAMGRAVVGTAVGGVPLVVADGISGAVVPPDDLDALVKGIGGVTPAMGEKGPEQVEKLSPRAHAAAVLAAYGALSDPVG